MPKGKGQDRQKLVHPNSRKAMVMARKNIRSQRLQKNKYERDLKQNIDAQKMVWFKENLSEDTVVLSALELSSLIDNYLHRFDEELQQIEIVNGIKGRKKEQYSSRKNTIRLTIERETQQFNNSGFYVPNLMLKKVVGAFRSWDGTTKSMVNIEQIKTTRRQLSKIDNEAPHNNDDLMEENEDNADDDVALIDET